LVKDYTQRPYAQDLLDHPFVRGKDSLKPIRELLKLAEADVEEVLEDIPEDESQPQQPHPSSAVPMNISTPSAGSDSTTPATASPPSTPSVNPTVLLLDSTAKNSPMNDSRGTIDQGDSRRTTLTSTELAPKPTYLLNQHRVQTTPSSTMKSATTASAAAMSLLQSELSALSTPALPSSVPGDDANKKFKTLTRIRQFVNEEGETVTVKTSRIVQTSEQSGRVGTIKRGERQGASASHDWGVQDQRKLAVLRKQQEHEMKRWQRDELKECSELIVKLKLERDQQASFITLRSR
jgi:hypothetical protein